MDSMAPSAGEGTSTVTLSVSSSSSGSSRATASPSFLNQRATVASVTDLAHRGHLDLDAHSGLLERDSRFKASLRNAAVRRCAGFIRPAAVEAYSGRPI